MTKSPPAFRLSLREFFALVATVAFGTAALCYANEYWVDAVSVLTLLAFMSLAIVAVIDRGLRQVSALGFVVAGAIYGALLYSSDSPLHDEKLPTTRLMRPLHGLVAEQWYYDAAAKRMIRESELPPGATSTPWAAGADPGAEAFIPRRQQPASSGRITFPSVKISCASPTACGPCSSATSAATSHAGCTSAGCASRTLRLQQPRANSPPEMRQATRHFTGGLLVRG